MILGAALTPLAAACATQSEPTEQAPAPIKVPVSVQYVHQWSSLYLDRLEKVMADFTAKNPNVKAEHLRVSNVHTTFATNQAAGSPADVNMLWRSNMPAIAVKNGIMDLGPLILDEFWASVRA
jgi:ABC-type glycerol-3-phosphate transport system substrate-binding protein